MRRENIDEWLKRQIHQLNEDLPRERKTLRELLESDEPSVKTLGGVHYFSREELEKLSEILPERLRKRVTLPLVFRRSIESSESIYFLDGGEVEAETVKLITGLKFLPSLRGRYYTYKPVISLIVSKYPSILVLGVT